MGTLDDVEVNESTTSRNESVTTKQLKRRVVNGEVVARARDLKSLLPPKWYLVQIIMLRQKSPTVRKPNYNRSYS
jgi:hypothetical protein